MADALVSVRPVRELSGRRAIGGCPLTHGGQPPAHGGPGGIALLPGEGAPAPGEDDGGAHRLPSCTASQQQAQRGAAGADYASVIVTFSRVSPGSRSLCGSRTRILFTMSMPSTTLPKTAWRPLRCGVARCVMKTWLPYVFGPALAMERMPGPSCFRASASASSRNE